MLFLARSSLFLLVQSFSQMPDFWNGCYLLERILDYGADVHVQDGFAFMGRTLNVFDGDLFLIFVPAS